MLHLRAWHMRTGRITAFNSPEVTHTHRGTQLLKNFAVDICKARQDWTIGKFVDQEIARIRALVGEKGQVIGAVSGGVDSTVAAKLMQEAIGDRFHAVLVDNGVLRLNEAQQVKETLTKHLSINLTVVNASERFLGLLKGVKDDPGKKRKVVGNTFIELFQEEAKKIAAEAAGSSKAGEIEWLLQGTLYPDVIESISSKARALRSKPTTMLAAFSLVCTSNSSSPFVSSSKTKSASSARIWGFRSWSGVTHSLFCLSLKLLTPSQLIA